MQPTNGIQQGRSGGNAVTSKRATIAYTALGQRTTLARFQSTGTTNAVPTTDYTYASLLVVYTTGSHMSPIRAKRSDSRLIYTEHCSLVAKQSGGVTSICTVDLYQAFSA